MTKRSTICFSSSNMRKNVLVLQHQIEKNNTFACLSVSQLKLSNSICPGVGWHPCPKYNIWNSVSGFELIVVGNLVPASTYAQFCSFFTFCSVAHTFLLKLLLCLITSPTSLVEFKLLVSYEIVKRKINSQCNADFYTDDIILYVMNATKSITDCCKTEE